ncbi:putative reverse transcriptase domain-containing protein [Tanacetum coccineum]|uniref:Reverse transcriptase domain-containing protein n=1 Tax=Tanacetum coccineum TaxID=301880 RepID=A0ABQ5CQ57_9ASTR
MRQQRWLDLLKDYDCEIRYHPGKANVVADTLSRKEREKVTRIHSLQMIVTFDLFDRIKVAQLEASKEENWKSERITSYISYLEDDSRGIKTRQGRIYIPFRSNVKELLLKEAHKSKYSIHPGAKKMYLDLKRNYWWSGMKRDCVNYHASIKMPPYEMLYGRKCRTPVCWDEVGSRELASTDVVLATTEKIEIIRERLKEAIGGKCMPIKEEDQLSSMLETSSCSRSCECLFSLDPMLELMLAYLLCLFKGPSGVEKGKEKD